MTTGTTVRVFYPRFRSITFPSRCFSGGFHDCIPSPLPCPPILLPLPSTQLDTATHDGDDHDDEDDNDDDDAGVIVLMPDRSHLLSVAQFRAWSGSSLRCRPRPHLPIVASPQVDKVDATRRRACTLCPWRMMALCFREAFHVRPTFANVLETQQLRLAPMNNLFSPTSNYCLVAQASALDVRQHYHIMRLGLRASCRLP